MLNEEEVNELINELKKRAKDGCFIWKNDQRQDELVVSVSNEKIKFILSMKKGPFEIRLHFRTKKGNFNLMRIDNAPYHCNPDGEEIRAPHLHYYVECEGANRLPWAKVIDWYNLDDPIATLNRFLNEIRTQYFQVQEELF